MEEQQQNPVPITPTPATQWQGKVEVEGTDLPLPSGNVARVRQLGPTAFLTSGMIPDPLTSLVRQAINSKQGLPPSALNKIADDPKQLTAALEMFDRVLVFAVIMPSIEMPPACAFDVNLGVGDPKPCGEYANTDRHQKVGHPDYHKYREGDREPGTLYADQVKMDDKMFVFNWVLGGTRDLSKFREQLSGTVESLQDSKPVQGKAKRAPRRK